MAENQPTVGFQGRLLKLLNVSYTLPFAKNIEIRWKMLAFSYGAHRECLSGRWSTLECKKAANRSN